MVLTPLTELGPIIGKRHRYFVRCHFRLRNTLFFVLLRFSKADTRDCKDLRAERTKFERITESRKRLPICHVTTQIIQFAFEIHIGQEVIEPAVSANIFDVLTKSLSPLPCHLISVL